MIKINEDERRDFFRVNDEVYLKFETVSDEEYSAAPEKLKNIEDSAFSLSANFATLNNTINPLLNSIKQQYAEVGEFLDFLNSKIDNLSEHVLYDNLDNTKQAPVEVNISASGIQFNTSHALSVQQALKLELILLPEKIGILIYGRVVDTKEKSVCVEFEYIRPEDKELMIKHNLNKQMLEIREKKDNN